MLHLPVFAQDLFNYTATTLVHCHECKAEEEPCNEEGPIVALTVANAAASTLEISLGKAFGKALKKADGVCMKCKGERLIFERKDTRHDAHCLVLHLERFSGGGPKKTDHVKFEEVLQLHGAQYDLKAVIVHGGISIADGRFFAVVRGSAAWWLCDDARVEETTAAEVLQMQAYILFYVRSPPPLPEGEDPLSQPSTGEEAPARAKGRASAAKKTRGQVAGPPVDQVDEAAGPSAGGPSGTAAQAALNKGMQWCWACGSGSVIKQIPAGPKAAVKHCEEAKHSACPHHQQMLEEEQKKLEEKKQKRDEKDKKKKETAKKQKRE